MKISVIIPVYNAEKFVRRSIDSVLNQTYQNIEVILINDGSTDQSGKICDEYALSDKRIKVIHTKNNGSSAARNIGIENSNGEFMFFVDADDFVDSNAIKLLIENYQSTKADMIAGDFTINRSNNNSQPEYTNSMSLLPNSKLLVKQDIIDYVISYLRKPTGYSLLIYSWGKLFKTSIIKENNIYFNTDLLVFEDVSFNFEYLKYVNSVYYIKYPIYTYIVHDDHKSQSMRIYDNPVVFNAALKSIGQFLNSMGISNTTIKKEIGNACISLTIRTMIQIFKYEDVISIKHLYRLFSIMINDSDIRQNIAFYSPSKSDSKIIPILMTLKLVCPIILVCKYKYYRIQRKRAT